MPIAQRLINTMTFASNKERGAFSGIWVIDTHPGIFEHVIGCKENAIPHDGELVKAQLNDVDGQFAYFRVTHMQKGLLKAMGAIQPPQVKRPIGEGHVVLDKATSIELNGSYYAPVWDNCGTGSETPIAWVRSDYENSITRHLYAAKAANTL